MTEIMKAALDMVSSGIIVVAFGIFLVTMKKSIRSDCDLDRERRDC